MEYPFFKDVLAELSVKLNFDSIRSITANPYVSDSIKIVQEHNPMHFKIQEAQIPKRCTIATLRASGLLDNK